jgi:hypothetical protein
MWKPSGIVIAQGIKNAMLIAGQNRSSIPKNRKYTAPVNMTDTNAAIAEMTAVCRTGDKLEIVVFMKLSDSGDILNGRADAWLTRWYEIVTNWSNYGPHPVNNRPAGALAGQNAL